MSEKLRTLLFALSVTLILMVGAVGTYSYFTDTDEAVNTFTVGDVDITLEETTGNKYKMIPGITLEKDPVVTVKGGSVDCLVFIEVIDGAVTFNEKTYHARDFLAYSVGSQWKLLENNVYYMTVDKKNENQTLPAVLEGNKVVVKDTVTEEMMNDLITAGKNPELTFRAYAIQAKKGGTEAEPQLFKPAEAWAQFKPPAESGE